MPDLTIYGAGIFGLSIAFTCARRGARVRVIDPSGVGAGASGGVLGALAPHVPENWNVKKQFQFESLDMAEAFWRDVEGLSGLPSGYRRGGRVQPVWDARAFERAQTRGGEAETLWQGRYAWCVDAEECGWQLAEPALGTIRDTLSAHLHPRMGVTAAAKAIEALGGEILREGEAAGKVLWATGWAGLAGGLGNGVKGQAAVLEADMRGRPQLFFDGVHVIPHENGTVAIGSTSEREFDAPGTTDDALEALIAKTRAALSDLREAPVIARWAGVRPRAMSRAPILGSHPLKPGEYIANGGFKIGFGMAPKVGAVMADLLLENRDTIPEDFRAQAPA